MIRRSFLFLYLGCAFFFVWLSVTMVAGNIPVQASSPQVGTLDISLEPFAVLADTPVGLTNAGDDRLFVIEKQGRVRILEGDGSLLPTPFLDIRGRVDNSRSEKGLLGIAFHPKYADNGYFYLQYTAQYATVTRTRVSRFSVSATDPNVADPSSEHTLLTITQPDSNHNAGSLHFSPLDGYLYIPMGDGGGAGDSNNNAQNMTLLLGKIVRIDVDQTSGGVAPDCFGLGTGDYLIPNDNPFRDGIDGNCDEIWALGLRNPWQSSFDRDTGDLWIGDVGQNTWEEIDYQPATSVGGENYGWRCYEGNHPFNTTGCDVPDSYTYPIYEMSRSAGNSSVIGGYVYRGEQYPLMVGHYLATDLYSGLFWNIAPDGVGGWQVQQHDGLTAGLLPVAFGEGHDGELYLVSFNGDIYHVAEATVAPPRIYGYLPAFFTRE